jgi:hypothetical protein
MGLEPGPAPNKAPGSTRSKIPVHPRCLSMFSYAERKEYESVL